MEPKILDRGRVFKYILLGLVSVIVLLLFWSYVNNYLQKSRAAENEVTIGLSPNTGGFTVGEEKTIDVLVSAASGKKISGLDIPLKAEGNVDIVEVTDVVPLPSGDTAAFSSIVKNVGSKQARLASISQRSSDQLSQIVKFRVKFKGSGAGSGKIVIDKTKTQVVGTVTGGAFALGAVDSGNYNFGGSGAPSINAHFAALLEPLGTGGKKIFGPKDFVIDGQPAGKKISGFDVSLTFDPTLISVAEIEEINSADPDPTQKGKFTEIRKEIDNNTGKIRLSYVSTKPDNELVSRVRMGLTLQAKDKEGTGKFVITSAQVTGNIPQNAYSVNKEGASYQVLPGDEISPPNTPIPPTGTIITEGPTGSVNLNLRLRLQGVTVKPKTDIVRVRIGLAKAGTQPIYQTGEFKAGDDGIWTGTVSFNTPVGSGYKVLVKGGKHLQKKVCDARPLETAPGTYRCGDGNITLQAGVNSLDFSGIRMLVGDLPEQRGEGQNGVIDSFDISFVRQNLGKSTAEVLAVGDLNFDGIVDTQDFSLIIASLNVKADEL